MGLGKYSYEYDKYQLNYGDRDFGTICDSFSPSLRYLIDSAKNPKDLQKKLDGNFGKNNEDDNKNQRSNPETQEFFSQNYCPLLSMMN